MNHYFFPHGGAERRVSFRVSSVTHPNRGSFNGNRGDIESKRGVANFPRTEFLLRHRVIVRPQFTEADQCFLPVGADI
jgi:hypothetical protein